MAADAPPALLGFLDQLEGEPKEGLARHTVSGACRAMAHGVEGRFDRVRRADMRPVLSREVVEGEQRLAIFRELLSGLRILRTVMTHEAFEGGVGLLAGRRHPDFPEGLPGTAMARSG